MVVHLDIMDSDLDRYGSPWNNWGYRQRMNDYTWNNRNRTNTAYVVGRRSSNNVVVGNRTNVIKDRVIVNRNKPRVIDKDVVIDREIIKLKRGKIISEFRKS